MMRFVWIGDQVNEEASEFAIYDTVNDLFLKDRFGFQLWDSSDHFKECVDESVWLRCRDLIAANLKVQKKAFICTYEYKGQETEGNLSYFEKFVCHATDKIEALYKYHVWLCARMPGMKIMWKSLEEYRQTEYAAGGWGYMAYELVDNYGDLSYADEGSWWNSIYNTETNEARGNKV